MQKQIEIAEQGEWKLHNYKRCYYSWNYIKGGGSVFYGRATLLKMPCLHLPLIRFARNN